MTGSLHQNLTDVKNDLKPTRDLQVLFKSYIPMHFCISIHMPTSVYMTMSILKPTTFLCIIASRYVIGL